MVQFQVWSQVDADDVGGGDGCLFWLSRAVSRVGALLEPGLVLALI